MKRKSYAWLMCMLLLALSAFTATAARKSVYLVGLDNNWLPPVESNASQFEPYLIYETSEGSNIFEKEYTPYSDNLWFTFYTALSPDSEMEICWNQNRICPEGVGWNEVPMPAVNAAGIYRQEVNTDPMRRNSPSFSLPTRYGEKIKLTLDLNKKTLTAVSERADLLLLNTDKIPTIETAGEFEAKDGKHFIAPGDVKFRFWNAYTGKLYGAGSKSEIDSSESFAYVKAQEGSEEFFTVKGWKGGVMNFYNDINLQMDSNRVDLPEDTYLMLDTPGFFVDVNADNLPYLINEVTLFTQDGRGEFTADVSSKISALSCFRLKAIDIKTGKVTVYGPGVAERVLGVGDNRSIASAVAASADRAGWWKVPENALPTECRFNLSGAEMTMSYREQSDAIYLIGMPQGWMINEGTMPLASIGNDRYYGEFDINVGEAMFRFYTELGNWENNSWGSQYEDMAVDTYFNPGTENYYNLTEGKGAFNFVDWPGGKMYILVDLAQQRLTVSDRYIDHDVIEDDAEAPVIWIDDTPTDFRRVGDRYFAEIHVNANAGKLRLFSAPSPYVYGDGQWSSRNAISVNSATEEKEFGVTKMQISANASSDNREATAFELPLGSYRIYIDKNLSEVTVFDCNYLAYVGGVTDGRTPTVDSYREFAPYVFDRSRTGGMILDIPAGKFSLNKVYLDGTPFASNEMIDIKFEDCLATGDNNGFYGVNCADWKGGKVLCLGKTYYDITDGVVMGYWTSGSSSEDFSKIFEMNPLKETSAGSLVFKGSFLIPEEKQYNTGFNLIMMPEAAKSLVETNAVTVGQGNLPGMGMYHDNSLILHDGVYNIPLGFGTSGISSRNLYHGRADVTVDLNTMMLTMTLSEGENVSVLSLFDESLNGGDETAMAPSAGDLDKVSASVVTSQAHDFAFNITDESGAVLRPASGQGKVEFNENGYWFGKYTKETVKGGRSALREVAKAADKWQFSTPGAGAVMITVDTKSDWMSIHSSADNDRYILTPVKADMAYDLYVDPVVMTRESDDAPFEAIIRVEPQDNMDGNSAFYVHKGWMKSGMAFYPYGTVSPRMSDAAFSTPTEAGETINVFDENYSSWNMIKPGYSGYINVSYNPEAMAITLKYADKSGVDVIEDAGETIDPSQPMEVYGLDGIRVADSTEDLPKGIYIVRQGSASVKIAR